MEAMPDHTAMAMWIVHCMRCLNDAQKKGFIDWLHHHSGRRGDASNDLTGYIAAWFADMHHNQVLHELILCKLEISWWRDRSWADLWSEMSPVFVPDPPFQRSADYQTFEDEQGYAIDFPKDWFVDEQNAILKLASYNRFQNEIHRVPDDEAILDVLCVSASPSRTLMDDINDLQQTSLCSLVRMENLLLTGLIPAARLTLDVTGDLAEARILVAHINGFSIRIHGYGSAHLIDAVSGTLRASKRLFPSHVCRLKNCQEASHRSKSGKIGPEHIEAL